jgi:hypothetical protein
MNDFDRRWRDVAARARQAPEAPVAAPFGFATRVLSAVGRRSRGTAPLLLWERLGLRALLGVTTLLVILGAMEYRDARPARLAPPQLEHCVTAAFWML